MKKKTTLAIFISLLLIITFSACSRTKANDEPTTDNTTIVNVEPEGTTTVVTAKDKLSAMQIPYLHDYKDSSSECYSEAWMLNEDTIYFNGKLYNKAYEMIYTLKAYPTKVIGYTEFSAKGYFVYKDCSKIYLVTIDLLSKSFEEQKIAEAAAEADLYGFNRSDRFSKVYNEDALMQYRTVVYRNQKNQLVQIDITEQGVKSSVINKMDNKFLFMDPGGIAWIEKDKLEKADLVQIIKDMESPIKYVCTREGTMQRYSLEKY